METSILQALVRAILTCPLAFEWTVQGLGMLRLYLPGADNLRLHIWDSRLAFPGVSTIHTHPWDFESYVVSGRVHNTRWTEDEGEPFLKSSIHCGQGGCVFGEPVPVRLHPRPVETFGAGQSYTQHADEIHSSAPENGTISVLRRVVPAGRSADLAYVYWPDGEEWVTAEPRPARPEEVTAVTGLALSQLA